MTTTERSTVVDIFTDRVQANQAIDELHHHGFTDDHIGYVVRDVRGKAAAVEPAEVGPATVERATFGAAGGGVAGAIVGAAASLFIPAFNAAVAGSIVAATLGGLAVGAIAGAIVGVLISMAVPEKTTNLTGEIQVGLAVVTVNAPGREQEARDVLSRFGAADVVPQAGQSSTAAPEFGSSAATPQPDQTATPGSQDNPA